MIAAAPQTRAQSEPVATRPTAPPVPVIDSTEAVLTQQGAPSVPSCWRARPLCPVYFLTDIGIEFPVRQTSHPDPFVRGSRARDFDVRPVWTMGFMGTRGQHAHGPTVSLVGEFVPTGLPFMLEYRYRNWLGPSAAVDVSLGYKRTGFYETGNNLVLGKGLTAMIAWTPNRWIGLNARADIMRAASRDRRALLLGVESTRVSEYMFRIVLVETMRFLLASIGIEMNDEEEEP